MLRNARHQWQYWQVRVGLMAALILQLPAITVQAQGLPTSTVVRGQEAVSSWRSMTPEEEAQAWDSIFNSPLGIAAFNQLAIEGFISPICPKTFYTNDEFSGFQFMVRVQCPDARGVSTAVGYREMRVVFNRFESNIENFSIERVSEETPPTIPLP